MGVESGPNGSQVRRITREVRWFTDGQLPDPVLDWFTKGISYEFEERVDRYDLEAARRGMGNKVRDRRVVDLKHRLNQDEVVHLAPRLAGRAQDWVKVTRPAADWESIRTSSDIDISKEIYTRKYPLRLGQSSGAGCDVELSAITRDHSQAWSICFETFGDPGRRGDLLQHGVDRFLDDTPLPVGLELELKNSCSYPAWITTKSLQSV